MPLTLFQCCTSATSPELNVVTILGDPIDDIHACCKSPSECHQVIDISSDILDENAKFIVVNEQFDPFLSSSGISARGSDDQKDQFLSPCQKYLKDQLRLPAMKQYPVPLHCSPDDPEEMRVSELFKLFQTFVLEWHKGLYMIQSCKDMDARYEFIDVHCQLMNDLRTLKVDKGSCRIVEYDLLAVTRMVRDLIPLQRDNCRGGVVQSLPLVCVDTKHIVVLEFAKRSLMLVFSSIAEAQSFMMCMDLLVHFTRQNFNSIGRGSGHQEPDLSRCAAASERIIVHSI